MTLEQAQQRVDALTALAFATGHRVAIHVENRPGIGIDVHFVMLGAGEAPPRGRAWTIYENRGGIAVGRSA